MLRWVTSWELLVQVTWVRVSVLLRTVPQCPFKPTLKLSNIGARTVLVWETDIQMYYAHSL